MDNAEAVILSVDDDRDILEIVRLMLGTAGFEVLTAENGPDAVRLALKNRPALVLLDAMMPDMDGYEVAAELQSISDLQQTPIVFLTALSGEQDRQRAFSAGAVDYITKPFTGDALIDTVRRHISTAERFASVGTRRTGWTERVTPEDFERFRQALHDALGAGAEAAVSRVVPATVYSLASVTGGDERKIAEVISKYFGIGFLPRISPREIRLGVLPVQFCKTNLVVPIHNQAIGDAYVVANPFNWELIETLERAAGNDSYTLIVASPGTIREVFDKEVSPRGLKLSIDSAAVGVAGGPVKRPGTRELAMRPPAYVTDFAIAAALADGAVDVEYMPNVEDFRVSYRVDGELREAFSVAHESALMLVSRMKALAGLDINERRRAQRGSIEATVDGVRYIIRVVTKAAPHGEAVSLHMVRGDLAPSSPIALGMSTEQAEGLSSCLARRSGLVIVASPHMGGKTTTAYTVLSMLGPAGRNVMSAESPVEYSVPFVVQNDVEEATGATYPAVIASVVMQKPDVLFVGEIRDPETLRAVLGFAAEGLVIATVTAPSATGAISALEALGASREWLAENLVAIVGQRLAPLPCPKCSKREPAPAEKRSMLAALGVPAETMVVSSAGCDACAQSGISGRVGIFEIVCVGDSIREAVSAGATPVEIRTLLAQAGVPLLGRVALDAMIAGTISVESALSAGLAEDRALLSGPEAAGGAPTRSGASVLLVDDGEDNRQLLELTLSAAGYAVSTAGNGLEAIRLLERGGFDLVLSDLRMPLMDGFGLLDETARSHGVPLMIYSASTDPADEVRALDGGAIDFVRIPVRREVLVARVRHALNVRRPLS